MFTRLWSLLFALLLACDKVFALSTPTNPRVSLPQLEAAAFRHPLDRDLTNAMEALPLSNIAQGVLRQGLSVVEQGVRLDLLSSSVKVSAQQLPDLYQALQEACHILDFAPEEIPDLFVQSNAQANAYTLALRQGTNNSDRRPIVVVTSALLDRCSEAELQAILGHELGHLKCEHSIYLTLGGLASTGLANLPLIGGPAQDLLVQQWRLAAEFSCDRAALLVAQDAEVVNGAMLKLTSGTAQTTSVQAFVDQCMEYDALLKTANPLVRASIQQQTRTHPLPVRRVVELQNLFQSNDYQTILSKGTELEAQPTTDSDQ